MVPAFAYSIVGRVACPVALYGEMHVLTLIWTFFGRGLVLLFRLGRRQSIARWQRENTREAKKVFISNFYIRKRHLVTSKAIGIAVAVLLAVVHLFYATTLLLQPDDILVSKSCPSANRSGTGFAFFAVWLNAGALGGIICFLIVGILVKRTGFDSLGAKMEMLSTAAISFTYFAFYSLSFLIPQEIENKYASSPSCLLACFLLSFCSGIR